MTQTPTVSRRIILDLFILSGAAGLIYEVVWARQLVLVFGNTTQAVSAILTGFFGGMAIGSAVGGRLADRVRSTAAAVRPARARARGRRARSPRSRSGSCTRSIAGRSTRSRRRPRLLALVRFALALLALGPATILMGATLPTLTRYLTAHADAPGDAFGRLYAANTDRRDRRDRRGRASS